MKKTLFLIVLLSISLLFAEGFSINTPAGSISMSVNDNSSTTTVSSKTVTVEYLVNDIVKNLEQLEKYHEKLNKFDQKKCQNLLDEVYSKLALIPTNGTVVISSGTTSNDVSDGNVNINVTMNVPQEDPEPQQVQARPKPVEHEKVPMSSIDFNDWCKRIKNESFADDQLRVVNMGAKNVWLTCDQVKTVLGLFSFSEDQLDALKVLWPRVTDKQNSYKVLDSFTFSADKESAESIMN
ncbi:MAG: DUF4476 domain-containing protein [Candidatus Cloacimonetes bacterium]|nr:DUF4476 domain-containing protein [Candidatus Cloacimonadota bacterium]